MSVDRMTVKQVPIDKLPPDPKNPRRISEAQARKLMASLETFGAVEPAVLNVRTGELVGGHQRVQAARVLGWTKYPTVEVDLDRNEQRQLNLALNRISGEWDEDLLAEVLGELKTAGADLDLTGFEESELEKHLVAFEASNGSGAKMQPTGFQVVIECKNEKHQAQLLARFDKEGLSARPLML